MKPFTFGIITTRYRLKNVEKERAAAWEREIQSDNSDAFPSRSTLKAKEAKANNDNHSLKSSRSKADDQH